MLIELIALKPAKYTIMPFRASIAAVLMLAGLLLSVPASAAEDLKEISGLVTQGKHARALDKVNDYLADNPGDVQGQFLKGVILAEQSKRDEAIRIFTTITEEHPELPEPYNNLAVLYADQGNYEKARNALERAIKTHPSYATAHENLGDIYAKMASDAYDKALQLDKGNTRAQTKLALVKDLFTSTSSTTESATNKPAKPAQAEKSGAQTVAQASPSKLPAVAPPAKETPAPPAKEAPASKEKPAPAASKPAPPQDIQLLTQTPTDAAKSWAKAWAEQDVEAYLGHYAASFQPDDGGSRAEWEAQRRQRLAAPSRISVELSDISVSMAGNDRAEVSFKQRYKTGKLTRRTGKTLVMVKNGDKWLIERESVKR